MTKRTRTLRSIITLTFSITLLLVNNSCSVLDKAEPTPAYIFLDNFEVQTNSDNSQGSGAADIVDGWLFVDGTLIGVFELPAMVPVIYERAANKVGKPVISVLPGIKNNGLSNSRAVYPFYEGFIDSFELVPGNIDTISPNVKYQSSAIFAWLEDFEDRSISMGKSGVGVTEDSIRLITDPAQIFDDGKNLISAYIELDTGIQYFENSTISRFNLPRTSAIYLELNYNLDVSMQVGLYVYSSNGTLINQFGVLDLFQTDGQWQKTYVSLAEDINATQSPDAEFKIFFAARGNNLKEKSKIYIDNLKLVHF
jgi:hypothetical protein